MSADLNPFGSGASPKTVMGAVPYMPASQASALLRSGLAIAVELMQQALPSLTRAVLEQVSGRWDMDVGAPLVQRLLASRGDAFRHEYIERLRQRQDVVINALQRQPQDAQKAKVDSESMTLVDADTVQSLTLVERTAKRVFGRVEEQLRDLNFIVGFLTGRSHIRSIENPFAPDVFVAALVEAAEAQQLHAEAFDYLLHAFEKPLSEEIVRIHIALLGHFKNHDLDPVAIRRAIAPRVVPRTPRDASSPRHVSSWWCRGIFTGHTSEHEPHRLHACGRLACFTGSRAGASTEPIGPATATP